MTLYNYVLRNWAAGWPPVSYLDMLQINNAIGSLDVRVDTLEQRAPGLLADLHATSSSSFNTTETVVDSAVVTLVAGRRYRVKHQGGVSTSVSGATWPPGTGLLFAIRAKFTNVVDTSGTAVWINDKGYVSNAANEPFRNEATFTATATGTWAIVGTVRNTTTGTGAVAYGATSNHRLFTVEDIGL
ncbi:hypothetical protein VA596_49810 [Amycolatopsis sp., V23-08]|uniref:Minor tail protein n=1 Tax=Amycolatopsis heterodermiae TaxID=3110235 RepID=A0ABU5RN13_9PSEU|nr:hypothetical protein [Amycolatopsis sp., V23-08]MEA5367707.1 hypothetical protein [Amycolatopsis sp., V23-08]